MWEELWSLEGLSELKCYFLVNKGRYYCIEYIAHLRVVLIERACSHILDIVLVESVH